MGNINQINIKNCTYYFFNDMINIKDFDSTLIQLDKKSYRIIGIYNISYITIKKLDDYENIDNVNPLYLIIGKADGYIEENNGKYIQFLLLQMVIKKILEKFIKLSDEITHLIETVNEDKKGEYEKYFMKIKFNSNDNLPLNKMLKLQMLTVIVRSIFEEDGKNYPQVFLDECLFEV